MKRASFSRMQCSVARTLEVVGEWWTPLILRDAFLGVTRFDDFQQRLGIARNVLTARLNILVSEGIMEKALYQKRPERYEYKLTEMGRDLFSFVIALMGWGDRWTDVPRGPHHILIHDECGHEAKPVLICSHCGSEVTASNSHAKLVPGKVSSDSTVH